MLVSDDDMTTALETLASEEGAAWRATHNYLDALTKTLLSELMAQSNETSAPNREAWARRQDGFRDHLKKLGQAAKQDFIWRQRYAAAEAKIEIWRTVQANARSMERVR